MIMWRPLSRRSLIAGAACGVLASPFTLQAAQYKPARIAMILWRGETAVEKGFRGYLSEKALEVEITVYDLGRDLSGVPSILAELRRNPPDMVYTWGTGTTLATVGRWDEATPNPYITDIPVVFAMVSAPRETGIAPPADHPPRANLTGAVHVPSLPVQIAAMRAYLPIECIGVIYNPLETNSVSNIAALKDAAVAKAIEVVSFAVPLTATGAPDPAAIPGLVAKLKAAGGQLIYIGPDNFIGTHHQMLTKAGLSHSLPAFTATELEIREGNAMFGLVSRYEMVGRLAASKAIDILVEGKRPSDLPIETLDRFTYVIRLPVALSLGLYPPLPLLDYAEIIR